MIGATYRLQAEPFSSAGSRISRCTALALRRSGARIEVFVLATRLTRITRQLGTRSPNTALRRVAEKVVDWSGGTRIGESLRQLNQRWVRRTVRSGTVVLAGLRRMGAGRPCPARPRDGDPATLLPPPDLARPPWRAALGSEPDTVGLRAALPYVDDFAPCATVASLEEMAEHLGRL